MTTCDLLLVGVGGQGVLTIGDLLVRAAFAADVPASFCPTKGMAQRGGFVKVEIRLGAEGVGPRIGEGCADVVVAMERSEALRAIPFIKSDGNFLLYDHVWEPAGVQLGIDDYPSLEEVAGAIEEAGAHLTILQPANLPVINRKPAAANILLLGALLGVPRMAELLDTGTVESVISVRWPRSAEANLQAFRSGLKGAGGSLG
jgi:indolepyruvate ferredoxin oxidoreductase beta subunit